jgi:hypothetical protein
MFIVWIVCKKGRKVVFFANETYSIEFICLSFRPLFVRKKSAKKPPFVRICRVEKVMRPYLEAML